MKKVKMIIEEVKFIGLLAHLLEAFEFIESFIKGELDRNQIRLDLKQKNDHD